jgi:hypothetical protein
MTLDRAAVGTGGLSGGGLSGVVGRVLGGTVLGGTVLGGTVLGGTVLGAAAGGAVPLTLMAPEAATRTRRRTAHPAEPRTPAAPETPGAGDVPPTLCQCGHDAAAHEHYRRGSDCGACGAQSCARFRSARRPRGWLRGLRGRRAG